MKHIRKYELNSFDAEKWIMDRTIEKIENNLEYQYTKDDKFVFSSFIEDVFNYYDVFFNNKPKQASIMKIKYRQLSLNITNEFFDVFIEDMETMIREEFIKYHEYYKIAVVKLIVKYIDKDNNTDDYLEYLNEGVVPDFVKNAPELRHFNRGKNSGLLDMKGGEE